MPKFLQTVTDAITQGGPVMLFFIVFALIWFAAISAELIQKPFLRNPATHLLFPIGFLILIGAKLALGFYSFFESMRIAGPTDALLLSQDGMVFTRALIVLVTAAVLSFFSTLLILLWRARGRTVWDESQANHRDV